MSVAVLGGGSWGTILAQAAIGLFLKYNFAADPSLEAAEHATLSDTEGHGEEKAKSDKRDKKAKDKKKKKEKKKKADKKHKDKSKGHDKHDKD